jgi:hypothetical protein
VPARRCAFKGVKAFSQAPCNFPAERSWQDQSSDIDVSKLPRRSSILRSANDANPVLRCTSLFHQSRSELRGQMWGWDKVAASILLPSQDLTVDLGKPPAPQSLLVGPEGRAVSCLRHAVRVATDGGPGQTPAIDGLPNIRALIVPKRTCGPDCVLVRTPPTSHS